MAESVELTELSHTSAVEAFARMWWEADTGETEVDTAMPPWPSARAGELVIRAERV